MITNEGILQSMGDYTLLPASRSYLLKQEHHLLPLMIIKMFCCRYVPKECVDIINWDFMLGLSGDISISMLMHANLHDIRCEQ